LEDYRIKKVVGLIGLKDDRIKKEVGLIVIKGW
jgi:hypothetical protein